MAKRMQGRLSFDEEQKPARHFGLESAAKRYKVSSELDVNNTPMQLLPWAQVSSSAISSPIAELAHNMQITNLDTGTPKAASTGGTPMLLKYDSVASSYSSDSKSIEMYSSSMFELESEGTPQDQMPEDLDALISVHLKQEGLLLGETKSPEFRQRRSMRTVRRCLSMSQEQSSTPSKRLEAIVSTDISHAIHLSQVVQRSTSNCQAMSKNVVDIFSALSCEDHTDEPDLIGDLSRPCALPVLLTGVRHPDLRTISSDTLAHLLHGEYEKLVESFRIFDCRYPYEYEGGHILGADNVYTPMHIVDKFPMQQRTKSAPPTPSSASALRTIFIFHCEFSSERGPKLMRFLRSNDRTIHMHNYPALDYPELYLLHNGYKEFYMTHPDLCTPRQYIPMLAPGHNEEFRYFRAKSKFWFGGDEDSGIGGTSRCFKKSRMRLLYVE